MRAPGDLHTSGEIYYFDDMSTRLIFCAFLGLSFLSCFLACSSAGGRNSDAKGDSSSLVVSGAGRGGSSDTAFKTLRVVVPFPGAYVNEEYIDSLRKNQSPSMDQGVKESCIEIPDSTLKSTSMIYGFHEGGEGMIIVKKGDIYQFYDYNIKQPRDTIEAVGADRIRIGRRYFRKLKHPDLKRYDWGILEELLFSGTYRRDDGTEVVFGADGGVRGLDSLIYYQPSIDYTEEIDIDAERIMLGGNPEHLKLYAYQFHKDTLRIFRVEQSDYDSVAREYAKERLGEMIWKMVRK